MRYSRSAGDTVDQNQVYQSLRQREYTHPAFLSFYIYLLRTRRGSGVQPLRAIRASLVLSLPKPSFVFAHMIAAAVPRQLTPIPTPTHVDRHLSDSAALLRLSRCPHSRVFTPSPLTSV